MIEPTSAPKIKLANQSITDMVFRELYEAVITQKLAPGDKVSEVEIAKQLDVSRQPVRDVFFRLSKLGFLSIRPQRATLITHISPSAVLHASFIRVALEVECLRSAIESATDKDIANLRRLLEEQERVIDDRDPRLFHALDDEMHAALCDLSGCNNIWPLIEEQKAHLDRVRFLTLSEEQRHHVLEEHTAIIDAFAERNLKHSEKLLRTHLSEMRDSLSRIQVDYPDFFESES